MQAGKSALGSVKESAANVVASAKSGMDKTKAVLEEKVEKVTAHDPTQKEVATQRKEDKINQAEMNKQQTREHNAAVRQQFGGAAGGTPAGIYGQSHGHSHATTGATGHPTGTHQMSALPGHGTGQPAGGHVVEGVTGTHPMGIDAETGRTLGSNPRGGSETHQGYN